MIEPDVCAECFDEFHYDDCGGYNPPCSCSKCGGLLCRSCCEKENAFSDDDDDPAASGDDSEVNDG